jgi:hypothetical protein
MEKFTKSVKKYPEEYNSELLEAIRIITVPKYEATLFGSSIFKALIYAGDIDIIQKNIPVSEHADLMQFIIKRILHAREVIMRPNYFFGDIKVGRHPLYYPLEDYIGDVYNMKIVGYEPLKIMKLAKKYKLKELYNIPDNSTIDLKNWAELYKIIHNLATLRWKYTDILKGFLVVDKIQVKLSDAVKNSKLTKIDMYFINGTRLMEITNVLVDKMPDMDEIRHGIKVNMLIYLKEDPPNYPKAIKRAYSVSRAEGNTEMLEKLILFLKSNMNLLASVITDLSVIPVILETNNLNYVSSILKPHFNAIVSKMSNVYIIELSEKFFEIVKQLHTQSKKNIIDIVNKIIDILKSQLNILTVEFMQKNSINLYLLSP